MNFLSNLSTDSRAWLLLMVSALLLEISALFFQYILGLAPCIMCVYQRTALWAIFLSGLIGFMSNKFILGRFLAYAFWAVGAIWGLLIAVEHVDIQTAEFSFMFTCEIVPNFPSWAPLHEWLPMLFEANGDCGEILWSFLGYSMPQVMIVVFAVYILLLAVMLSSRIIKTKMI